MAWGHGWEFTAGGTSMAVLEGSRERQGRGEGRGLAQGNPGQMGGPRRVAVSLLALFGSGRPEGGMLGR